MVGGVQVTVSQCGPALLVTRAGGPGTSAETNKAAV